MTRRRRGTAFVTAVLVAAAVLLAGCGSSGSGASTPHAGAVSVIAGSELKDLEPYRDQIYNATGVYLDFHYTGTLTGAESIASGSANAAFGWFSSTKYLTLLPGGTSKVVASTPIMLSPVALGVKHSLAQRLGWVNNPNVTWKDIAAKAKTGELTYGMTNPSASNSGFSALVGVATALAGTGSALTSKDINAQALTDFFHGQKLTAGSSGFLSDSYMTQQDSLGGLINYESVLISLNKSGKLHEPLDIIYPKDGIVTADYPLLLLDNSYRAQYDTLVTYLKSADFQNTIMTGTFRRPVVPSVHLDSDFSGQTLLELSFPSSLDVVNTLLFAYLDNFSPPAHTIYVLDLSGSMEGDRLDSLKQAMDGLTGAGQGGTTAFARFRNREQVTIITFSDHVEGDQTFSVTRDASGNVSGVQDIQAYVDSLQAGGGTAIYSAMDQAYHDASAALQQDPSYFTSVVLMTDGENNAGESADDFLSSVGTLPGVSRVPAFTIRFGEGDIDQLNGIANATGGQVFDATTTPLPQIFTQIRGYQ